jgi:uracil-DNA glycosylase
MLTARQQHCLKGMGITQWTQRSSGNNIPHELAVVVDPVINSPAEVTADKKISPPSIPTPVRELSIQTFSLNDWSAIESAIQACQNCALSQSCTNKVPGKGNQQADLMIIGEAPGHDEDLQGKPFVGRAGQLLDRMLQAIDIDPQQAYITNILKCRPPNNRDPKVEETKSCAQFLQAQIQQLKPKVIFSVGRISAQTLLLDPSPLGRLRNRQYTLPDTDIPLLVTYHPAYLLRNPAEKAKVWQDLKSLKRLLDHATD